MTSEFDQNALTHFCQGQTNTERCLSPWEEQHTRPSTRALRRSKVVLMPTEGAQQERHLISSQIAGRALACLLVRLDFIGHFLVFFERTQTGALHGGNVDEHVLASIIGLNKAETLLIVKPLHSTLGHRIVPSIGCHKTLDGLESSA